MLLTRYDRQIACAAAVLAIFVTSARTPQALGAVDRRFEVGPVPAWVAPVDPPDAGSDEAGAQDGVVDLLSDSQIRVTATSVERYSRRVAKAVTAAGLEDVSQ